MKLFILISISVVVMLVLSVSVIHSRDLKRKECMDGAIAYSQDLYGTRIYEEKVNYIYKMCKDVHGIN